MHEPDAKVVVGVQLQLLAGKFHSPFQVIGVVGHLNAQQATTIPIEDSIAVAVPS